MHSYLCHFKTRTSSSIPTDLKLKLNQDKGLDSIPANLLSYGFQVELYCSKTGAEGSPCQLLVVILCCGQRHTWYLFLDFVYKQRKSKIKLSVNNFLPSLLVIGMKTKEIHFHFHFIKTHFRKLLWQRPIIYTFIDLSWDLLRHNLIVTYVGLFTAAKKWYNTYGLLFTDNHTGSYQNY